MKRILKSIITIILSLELIVYGTSPVIVRAATITLTVSPTSGTPGSSVAITAITTNTTSFNASETVTIAYDGTQVLSTTSNSTGGLSAVITIPASATGSHTITATGSTSASAGSITFTVTPSISINRSSGVTGSSVTITGAGFVASETGIVVTYDGTSLTTAPASPPVGSNGSWTATFTVPASYSGTHPIDAYGASTVATNIPDLTFTVTPNIATNRTSAAPGTSVTVAGTGFGASETGISVTYDGNVVATVSQADYRGSWTTTFTVPASPAGSHTIDVYGVSTSINSVPEITFTTGAGISASPPSAAPGSSVTITGAGFGASETSIIVTYDGKQIASVTAADATGGWRATFAIPTSPAGPHIIDAHGSATSATTVSDLTFTVTPGISVNRPSAAPGSSITITGSGFGASETGITIIYDGTATTSSISADATGGWKATFVIPASASGPHTIDANGPSSLAATITDLTFTVTPGVSTNRPSAAPGSSVTITGSGFGAGETGISVTYDDKTVASGITANSQGGWTATFTVPASTSGTHSIKAQGSITQLLSLGETGGFNIGAGISINPASSYVGATVVVTGSGFASNSPIKFTYDNKEISADGTTTDQSGSFNKSITIPSSQAGGHTIKISDGENNDSSVTFTMESTPPPTPTLLSPKDGAKLGILGNITPTLKWSSVTDDSGVVYTLQMDTEPEFSHPILEKKDISSSRYILTSSEALERGEYYWRVKAIDGASNQGDWSQVWELKSGLMPLSALVIIIVLAVALVGGLVYFFVLRRPRRYEGVPAPEVTEAARPVTAQWRLIEPGEGAGGERPLPYRLALPQAPKGEKSLSTEEAARLKVIIDFAQSLPLVEPGYNAKWLLDLAQNSMGIEASTGVYKQLLADELQVRYEPAWMRHPIFQDLAALLEGQPILQDLNAFVDAVNRCTSEATILLQEIYGQAIAEIPTDFLERGGWAFLSAVYADAMRWYLGKALRDPAERDYVIKAGTGEEAGAIYLWGEEASSFGESLIKAQDDKEALQFRALHLRLRRTYRSSDTVKQLVDMMTQMAVQRDKLSSAFSQFENFTP